VLEARDGQREGKPGLMNSFEIGESFVRYYQNIGFELLPSASLLDPSIPMTFVMSAGLVQVETALDQLGHSNGDSYVLRQKCFRHFDLDKIGNSDLHLSLFEMPGAFSFGHNGRQATVQRMWDFLTRDLRIDPNRLWATYFAGDKVSGHLFDADLESYYAWQDAGLPQDRIVGLGADHNFWKQGGGIDNQGPSRKCGPNTELFFDHGPQLSCGPDCRPGCGCGRFVEFSNSLFIFAEMDAETEALSLMEKPFTETVIGSERVEMILEGQPTVFELETIRPLIENLRSFYARQKVPFDAKKSECILVDHLRALVFLTADGAPPPGKGGRRRLMRILVRRVLAQMKILQIDSPRCLPALIDLIIALAGNRHPNPGHGRDTLLAYIEAEALAFERTLSRGYRQLDRLLAGNNGCTLDGRELVSLVKQFGIPVSLLKFTLARKGVEFRESEYLKAIEQWRRKLLASSAASH
jgi:alanyl-tRNA synthetase